MANESVVATNSLIGLQGQLDTVRSEVLSTNVGLQNIATLIQRDSLLDQQRLFEEREQEKILADREVRIGQQEELQRRVSTAVIKPVVEVERKMTSTFERITSALKFLFSGFLGIQFVRGIKSAANISLRALSGIGSFLKNSFDFLRSGLASLAGGFGAVVRSITGVTTKVSNAILTLATSPFKAIADVFKKLVPGVRSSGAAAASVGAGASGAAGGFGKFFGGAIRVIGGALSTAANIGQNDPIGAAIGVASMLPTPFRLPLTAISVADAFTNTNITEGFKNFMSGGASGIQMPKFNFGDISQNIKNVFGINLSAPAETIQGEVSEGTKPTQPSKPQSLQVVPFKPQTPSVQKPPITPSPEPKPDIISITNSQQQQPSVVSTETQTLTDVPLLSSSNPSNFYTLYAQVNYNVVM